MILEVYQVREAMETYSVTSFGGRVTPEAMDRLRGIVEQMRLCAAEPNTSVREHKAIALDRQFHEQIIGLAGNQMLDSFSRQLSLHVNMTLMHEKTYHALEADWAEMHASILDQLPDHPEKAVEMLRSQFARATELWLANGHAKENGD
jgi:DNA-binding GntR family transcriptional regulator